VLRSERGQQLLPVRRASHAGNASPRGGRTVIAMEITRSSVDTIKGARTLGSPATSTSTRSPPRPPRARAGEPRPLRPGAPVERIARLVRIPALRHRRHLLPTPAPAQALQCPNRGRLRYRLNVQTWAVNGPAGAARRPSWGRVRRRRCQAAGSLGVASFEVFSEPTHPAVLRIGQARWRSSPSPRDTGRAMSQVSVEVRAMAEALFPRPSSADLARARSARDPAARAG
jgi:hypothetical protein